ncbi:MAG: hypothetical protein HY825_18865 [Acidobacteria bacterium]|nr:hypothetical protein [Acidobacteriota bacterium]
MAASAILLGTLIPIHASSAATWRSLGPDAAATTRLVVSPSQAGAVFLATGNGVFRSTDAGAHWASRGLQGSQVCDLATSPADPDLLVATVAQERQSCQMVSVFRSVDGGATWTRPDPSATFAFGAALALDPTDPEIAWLAAESGLFRSADGGQTWHPLATVFWGTYPPRRVLPAPAHEGRLYATGGRADRGVCRSEDFGDTWVCFPQGLPESAWYLNDVAVDPTDDRHLLTATNDGVYASNDSGESWAMALGGPPAFESFSAVAFAPSQPRIVYAVGQRALTASADGGATWSGIACGSTGFPCDQTIEGVAGIVVSHDDAMKVWASGSREGPMFSADAGQTWTRRTAGLRNAYVTAVHVDQCGALLAGTELQGVFRSDSLGATWEMASNGLPYNWRGWEQPTFQVGGFAQGAPQSPLYAATPWGLFATANPGATWSLVRGWSCTSVLADAAAPEWLLTGSANSFMAPGGIFRSQDAGTTWTNVSPVPGQTSIGALLRDPYHPQTVLAAGEIRLGGTWVGALRSDDGGSTWLQGMSVPVSGALALAADPMLDGTLYLGTHNGGVFRSADLGLSWQAARSGLPGWAPATWYPVGALLADPGRPGTVYAGTWSGVYVSRDRGDSWAPFGTGSPPYEVRALALADGGRTLLAGTFGAGVLALDLSAPRPPRRTLVHAP